MIRILYILILLLPFSIFAQKTSDLEYEKEVHKLLKFLKKKNYNLDSIQSQTLFLLNNYDLDCVQKPRIFQKLGTGLYYAGLEEEAVTILRDSTINAWRQCSLVDKEHYFSAVRILIEILEQQNKLREAKIWIKFLESDQAYFQNQNPILIFKHYKFAASIFSKGHDFFAAEQYYKKAENSLADITRSADKYYFDYYNSYGNYLKERGRYNESIINLDIASNHYYYEDDQIIYFCNILDPLVKTVKNDRAKSISDSIVYYLDKEITQFYIVDVLEELCNYYLNTQNHSQAQVYIHEHSQQVKKKGNLLSGRINNTLLKAKHAFLVNQYDTFLFHTNSSIGELIKQESFDIRKGPIESDINASYVLELLLEVLEDSYALVEQKYLMENAIGDLEILLNLAQSINVVYDMLRRDFNSEVSGIAQIENTYSFYEDAFSLCYMNSDIKSKQPSLNQLLHLSLSHKNAEFNRSINLNKLYQSSLSNDDYLKLRSLVNDKRTIEVKLYKQEIKSKKVIDSLNNQYIEKKYGIESLLSDHAAELKQFEEEQISVSSVSTTKDLISGLPDDYALLDFFFGEYHIYIFNVTKNNIAWNRVERTAGLDSLISAVYKNLHEGGDLSSYKNLSTQLYKTLFQSQTESLEKENIKTIAVLSDGLLHEIPLESYYTGKEYLVDRFDFIYLSDLSQFKKNEHRRNNKNLAYATSYSSDLNTRLKQSMEGNDINLSSITKNLDEIKHVSISQTCHTRINTDASKTNFLKDCESSNFDIIHLAVHGILVDEDISALIFDDNSEDFILDSDEIYSKSINSNLTVLSTCYSAKGRVFSGEGVRNLAKAFLFSGSENVISSLWAASDYGSNSIMKYFYSNLDKSSNYLSSLSDAKREYLNNCSPAQSHPYYWSHLVLTGSPTHSAPSYSWIYYLISGIVFLILSLWFFKTK